MEFQYDYFEIRAKLPMDNGYPAFLAMSARNQWLKDLFSFPSAEVDVFEVFGDNISVDSSIHTWCRNADQTSVGHSYLNNLFTPYPGRYRLPNNELLGQAYHNYSCEWTKDKLVFYVDGNKYTEVDIPAKGMDVFHAPLILILGVTAGSTTAVRPPESVTEWLCLIDNCRIYQIPGTGEVTVNK